MVMLKIELLESRDCPSIDVTAFTGASVTFQGGQQANTLVLGESAGLLTHNLLSIAHGGDYADASDVDPSAGVAYLPVSGSTVTVLFGAQADTLKLDSSWTFAASVGVSGNTGTDTLDCSAVPFGVSFAVTGVNAVAAPNLTFSSCERLTGTAGNDVFAVGQSGQLGGSLAGGGGTDSLSYVGVTFSARVNLALGTATNLYGGIAGITNVTGGSGRDILIGDAGANVLSGGPGVDVLVGNGGDDTLAGGDGNDVLIGGDGADVLDGGSGDDLLISGATTWDGSVTPLVALATEWGRTDIGYSPKLDHVRGVSGGINGTYTLTATTLLPDSDSDTLTGGAGQDAYWLDLTLDVLTDLGAGEQRFDHDTGAPL